MSFKSTLSNSTLLILTLALSACGGSGSSPAPQVAENIPPSVSAGDEQTVNEGIEVTLSGTASDSDGQVTSHQWQQISGTNVTLDTPTNLTITFTAPEVTEDESLVFELTVTDNEGKTASDTVSINVANVNQLPTADAGADQSLAESTQHTISGAGSDPDGQITSYLWQQTAGTAVNLETPNTNELTFTTPAVIASEVLGFSLTVTDNDGASATDNVEITVFNVNQVPVVSAAGPEQVEEQTSFTLQGSATDADGSIVSYQWQQIGGMEVNLYNTDQTEIDVYALPVDSDETLIFELTATDNEGATSSSQVEVTVLAVEGLIRDIEFGSSALRACVIDLANENNFRTVDQITTLSCGFESLFNFVGMEALTSLTQLSLWDYGRHTGLSSAHDLSPLANLTELTDLSLRFPDIKDISPLSNLTKLTNLSLTYGLIEDLSPLANLANLTSLDLLENGRISDISSLANLTSLTKLILEYNSISDISALSGLTALTYLKLYANQFSDLSALSGLSKLESLFVGLNSNLTDITGIFNLTNLTYISLYMSNNIPCADLETLQTNIPNADFWLPDSCVE